MIKEREKIQPLPKEEAMRALREIAKYFARSFGYKQTDETTFEPEAGEGYVMAKSSFFSSDAHMILSVKKNDESFSMLLLKDECSFCHYDAVSAYGERGFKWAKIAYSKYKALANSWKPEEPE